MRKYLLHHCVKGVAGWASDGGRCLTNELHLTLTVKPEGIGLHDLLLVY